MYDYLPSFYFTVSITGISDRLCFQEVSGLEVQVEVEEVKEGGENGFVHKLPKGVKCSNLILKRAMSPLPDASVPVSGQDTRKNIRLHEWVDDALLNFRFDLKDVIINLMKPVKSEDGKQLEMKAVRSWCASGAYPVKMTVSHFNAKENNLAIETLELAYRICKPVSTSDLKNGNTNK